MLNREEIDIQLASAIVNALSSDIDTRGVASLLVSGGSTPANLFRLLSQSLIDWSRVTICLADDRILPEDHNDQNGRMVQKSLLTANAKAAGFIPLVYTAGNAQENLDKAKEAVKRIPRPFTAVVLGMGTDGHTASLFAGSDGFSKAMDMSNPKDLVNIVPPSAPYQRITFTRRALLESKNIFLHIYGDEKRAVLDRAMNTNDINELPISGFLKQNPAIEIFWAQ